MKTVPRAALCVTILDDEDYRILMASRCGPEAFGVFTAMLVLGRERIQQSKARQLSGTESLRFDNSTTHLLAMTHLNTGHLDRCLKTLAEVAKSTGSEPWMYIDDESHLVIRSFFKFNTSAGWGGPRPGAGRKSNRNQDDSSSDSLENHLKESRFHPIPITNSIKEPAIRADAPVRVREEPPPTAREPFDPTHAADADVADLGGNPRYLKAVESVRVSLGDAVAIRVGYEVDTVGPSIRGRWDCLAAAAAEIRLKMDQRNGTPIRSPYGLMLSMAREYSLKDGPPPPPIPPPPPKPREPRPAYMEPLVITDAARARVMNAKPPARPATPTPTPAPPPKTGTGA